MTRRTRYRTGRWNPETVSESIVALHCDFMVSTPQWPDNGQRRWRHCDVRRPTRRRHSRCICADNTYAIDMYRIYWRSYGERLRESMNRTESDRRCTHRTRETTHHDQGPHTTLVDLHSLTHSPVVGEHLLYEWAALYIYRPPIQGYHGLTRPWWVGNGVDEINFGQIKGIVRRNDVAADYSKMNFDKIMQQLTSSAVHEHAFSALERYDDVCGLNTRQRIGTTHELLLNIALSHALLTSLW